MVGWSCGSMSTCGSGLSPWSRARTCRHSRPWSGGRLWPGPRGRWWPGPRSCTAGSSQTLGRQCTVAIKDCFELLKTLCNGTTGHLEPWRPRCPEGPLRRFGCWRVGSLRWRRFLDSLVGSWRWRRGLGRRWRRGQGLGWGLRRGFGWMWRRRACRGAGGGASPSPPVCPTSL